MALETTGSWSDWTARLEGELDRDDTGGLVIRCPGPGHSPADRSLSVWIDADSPGGFRVHSFAVRDDDFAALRDFVRAKVGAPEWKPNGKANGHDRHHGRRGTLVEQYVYDNAEGMPVLRVSRYANPKSFAQSRWDGSGWVKGGVSDKLLVPYKLPEVLEAIALGRTVHITEGEKGALALWKHGVAATCSPMGAGKWRDHYSAWLRDADVVILPDNDAPGRKHADQVAHSLDGVAGSVRIINLPGLGPGEDVWEYLSRGGDPHGIVNLRSGPPKRGFTAAELWGMNFPPVSFAVPRYIAEGLTLFAGAPKRGKSWLALDICVAVARGGFTLGDQKCGEGDALYCALEDSPRRIKDRLRKVCQLAAEAPDRLTVWFGADVPRLGEGCEEALRGWLEQANNPRLVVIDTLNFVRPERGRDEDPYSYDYRTVTTLQRMAQEFGVAMVLVHHTRKSAADDYLESISGTNGLTGGSDAVMVLERGMDGAYVLKGRGRDIEEFDIAMRFDKDGCRWSVLGDAGEARVSETRSKILRHMQEAGWFLTVGDIASQCGLPRNVVDQQLFKMVKAGEVVRVSRGKYGLPDKVVPIDGGRADDPED